MSTTATRRGPAQRTTPRSNGLVAASRTVSLSAAEKILGLSVAIACDHYSRLSVREKQVAAMMAKGKRNAKIAEELGISPKTLDIHRANSIRKLEVETTAGLANLINLLSLAEVARGN